jgi:hypothetical protein
MAAVLGVVFLGVAAMQGPKLLKSLNGSSSSLSPGVTTTTSATPGAAGSPTATSPTTGVAVAALGPGQLSGFSLFNPVKVFKPIPKPPAIASSAPSAAASKAGSATAKGAATTTTSTPTLTPALPKLTTPALTTPVPAAKTTTTTAPPVTFTVPNGIAAAVVTVNGKKQLFGAGATFPQDAPLFKLAAIAKKGLHIIVLGGTFVDGKPYLVLTQGNKVTLLNQSDGTKFVIKYVKKTFAPANELTSPTQTAATATTPAAPASTAAATPATTTTTAG